MVLEPGWRWIERPMARVPSEPVGGAVVLDTVDDPRHVPEAHRRAIALGDDLGRKLGGIHQLAVGVDQGLPGGAVQRAGGDIDVGRR